MHQAFELPSQAAAAVKGNPNFKFHCVGYENNSMKLLGILQERL